MAAKKLSFEEKLSRLGEIVATLEKGDAPLADSLRLFEEGDPSDNLPGLTDLFNEILNKSIPFQCKDWGGNHCEYCDYKDLCCL